MEPIEMIAVTLDVSAVERYIDHLFLTICTDSALPADEDDAQWILARFDDTDYVEGLLPYREGMQAARDEVAYDMMQALVGDDYEPGIMIMSRV